VKAYEQARLARQRRIARLERDLGKPPTMEFLPRSCHWCGEVVDETGPHRRLIEATTTTVGHIGCPEPA
jgi:hypothetical protein